MWGQKPFDTVLEEKVIVKDVTFGIDKGEILVLLGPSGAGKTTAMKCINGELIPDSGAVKFGDESYSTYEELYRNGYMGYCPQFDALFPNMTIQEHFTVYGKLRGYSGKDDAEQSQVKSLVKALGLEDHVHKLPGELSGGWRRKVSFALAILSAPKCVILDEPSTGMDIGARQKIWKVLNPQSKDNLERPALIISTHDMGEAEALASKVVIMINGEVVSFGTIQELTQEHCKYLFLEATTPVDKTENASEKLLKIFEESEALAALPGKVKLKILIKEGDSSKALGEAFTKMESCKGEIGVEYYSVAQMTLEQIFVQLSAEKLKD